MLGGRDLIEAQILRRPIEIGVRQIDAHARSGAACGRIDTRSTRVAEQIEKAGAGRALANQRPGQSVIEKQTRVEMMLEVDPEAQSPLLDHEAAGDRGRLRAAAVYRESLMPIATIPQGPAAAS